MIARKLCLVGYDISAPRWLARALDLCREYATGGQKSVRGCWLIEAEKRELLTRLAGVIDGESDRVHLLRLDPHGQVRAMGLAVKREDGSSFLLGA